MIDEKYGYSNFVAEPTNNDLPPTESQPGDYQLPVYDPYEYEPMILCADARHLYTDEEWAALKERIDKMWAD